MVNLLLLLLLLFNRLKCGNLLCCTIITFCYARDIPRNKDF